MGILRIMGILLIMFSPKTTFLFLYSVTLQEKEESTRLRELFTRNRFMRDSSIFTLRQRKNGVLRRAKEGKTKHPHLRTGILHGFSNVCGQCETGHFQPGRFQEAGAARFSTISACLAFFPPKRLD